MADAKSDPLVWVKDNAGNRFLCPLDSLVDLNSVSEEQKANCVDDASEASPPSCGGRPTVLTVVG